MYIGVIVAAVLSFAFSMLWYSPVMFGTLWLKLSEFSPKQLRQMKGRSMTQTFSLAFLLTLVMAAALAFLIPAPTYDAAVSVAFVVWLGILVAGPLFGDVLWNLKSKRLFFLNAAYWLINLEIIAVTLMLFA